MPEQSIEQLHDRSDTCKILLGLLMDENIQLKNRLSAVVQVAPDMHFLEEVENFHSRFIKEDERIGLLRNEVAELDKLLGNEIHEDGCFMGIADSKLKALKNSISTAENQIEWLKTAFNEYLSEKTIPCER